MKKRNTKPPSRVKYERNHPTVSFRVSKELKDRLEAAKKKEGKSTTDVLKIGVGLLEVKVRSEEEIRDKAHEEGLEEGMERATAIYLVTYRCSVCNKTIEVTTSEEKKTIAKYMHESGWGHADCIDTRP